MVNPAESWETVKLEERAFFREDWKMDATLSSDLKFISSPCPPIFTFSVDCLIVSREKAEYTACNKTWYEQL